MNILCLLNINDIQISSFQILKPKEICNSVRVHQNWKPPRDFVVYVEGTF
jgi:hypothetical protein